MRQVVLAVFSVLLISFSSWQDPLKKIINGFNQYLQQEPQEKVYMHVDRSIYFSGDTIWFKSYLVGGPNHEASQLSSTLYVELINEKGELIAQIKKFVTNGSSSGQIDLPDTLNAGNYTIRAYTSWMRNFPEEYFFYKNIKIWNSKENVNERVTNERVSVQFFPEGGDLIANVSSRIAFKAVGEDGFGRVIKGKIVDEVGQAVISFESNVLGMGGFMLTPRNGKRYRAEVEGLEESIPLPIAKNDGVALSVINVPQQQSITIRIEGKSTEKGRMIYLFGQNRGVVSFTSEVKLSSDVVYSKIDKEQLSEGITQITLIDLDGTPLCERLIYIEKSQKPLSIKVIPDKKVYRPREKASLTIEVRDKEDRPISTSLSLAVCDDQSGGYNENSETIYSYLHLTSELKGFVESPGYYFNPSNADRHMALDWLLMTQGWRKFTLNRALNFEPRDLPYAVEQGLTIKGRMIDKYSNKPIPFGIATYVGFGSHEHYQTANTNAQGNFEFNNVIYFDSDKVAIQGETKKGKKWVDFIIDTLVTFPRVNYSPPFKKDQAAIQENLALLGIEWERSERKKNAILLDPLMVKAKKPSESTPGRIFGGASSTVKVAGNSALESLLHPLELLQNRVPGIQVTGAGTTWNISVRGSNVLPLIMIDDTPVPIENLSMLPVRDIESVDVWKGPSAAKFGLRGNSGVIGFYTRKGVGTQTETNSGIYRLAKSGFQSEREFYVPVYDVKRSGGESLDRRVTLFWNPNVQTDSTGRAVISFYNHDLVARIEGIIEGITQDGKMGSSSFTYDIEKDND